MADKENIKIRKKQQQKALVQAAGELLKQDSSDPIMNSLIENKTYELAKQDYGIKKAKSHDGLSLLRFGGGAFSLLLANLVELKGTAFSYSILGMSHGSKCLPKHLISSQFSSNIYYH